MGNREQLLDAAKKCLFENGYERTTVRDIADLAQVSKAAIGYHFGSKEELLNAALFDVLDNGGATAQLDDEPSPTLDDIGSLWTNLIASFSDNDTFWRANLEAVLVAQRDPKVRRQLAAGMSYGRSGIAAELTATPEKELPCETVRTLGSVQLALMGGLMMQWLTDPDSAPSAEEVVEGIRALAKLLPESQ